MQVFKNKTYRVFLGSQSPRRQYLIKEMGIDYELKNHKDIDETYPQSLQNQEIALFLAKLKFDAYQPELVEGDLLITADTIVCLDNHVLGKPQNREDALDMLNLLSGKTHRVFTGLCVGTNLRHISVYDQTEVSFAPLSQAQIGAYVDTFKPFDKAGSYGIQDWIGYVGIERISGSFYNVMGLPTHVLYRILKDFDA